MKALVYRRAAIKALKRMPAKDCTAIREKLSAFAEGRRGELDVKPLKGSSYLRLRHGDWRAVVEEGADRVEVVVIAHRREVYR